MCRSGFFCVFADARAEHHYIVHCCTLTSAILHLYSVILLSICVVGSEGSATSGFTFGEIAHAQHNLSELSSAFA